MRRKKWRGTILFVVILTVMGLTIGLRLYGVGHVAAAAPIVATSAPAATSTSSPAATTAPSSSASASPSAAPAAATRTVDGNVENTPYGPIQVQLTFSGKTITAVTVLQSPNDRARSVDINAQATPILAQEVLSSQSAKIDTVSGASYTSDGYRQSVQSAIDKS